MVWLPVRGEHDMNTAQMRKLSREVRESRNVSGLIIMFYGTVDDIPLGWQICDGTNGTPNLTDRMILGWGTLAVGDSGGGDGAHTHGTSEAGGHTHTCNQGGTHTIKDGAGEVWKEHWSASTAYTYEYASPAQSPSITRKADGDSTSAALHTHSLGSGTHTHTALSTSDCPAYRRLMFLMPR